MHDPDLDWFRRHLDEAEAGVLTPEEQDRFDLLATRPDFREIRQKYRERHLGAGDGEVLPAGILADWPAAVAHLQNPEREWVQQHLRENEESREVVRELGHDPEEIFAPPASRQSAEEVIPPLRVEERDSPESAWSRLSRWWKTESAPWATGWALAASVAVLWIAVQNEGGDRGASPAGSTHVTFLRGSDTPQLTLSEDRRSFLLTFAAADVAGTALAITLIDSADRVVARHRDPSDLSAPAPRGPRAILMRADEPLSPGVYTLQLSTGAEAIVEVPELP